MLLLRERVFYFTHRNNTSNVWEFAVWKEICTTLLHLRSALYRHERAARVQRALINQDALGSPQLHHPSSYIRREQVTVLQEDGLLAEYVHILAGSALVEPGDRVAPGQQLCSSGGAGFCPTPHLHLQLQEGESDTAPTVQFALLDCEGNPYFPVAGKSYGSQGEASPQQKRLGTGDVVEGTSCGGGRVDNNPGVASETPRSR